MAGRNAAVNAERKANGRGYRRHSLHEVKDQVAFVTIDRPRVLNAFREQTLDELIDALEGDPRDDPSIACARW